MLVTIVAIALLGWVLLNRLYEVERSAERAVLDSEIAGLRAELQLAVASRIVRGEEGALPAWIGRNPLELASGEPRSVKSAATVGGIVLGGPWRWNAQAGALEYEYRDGGGLQLRLAKNRPGQSVGWALGGGLLLVAESVERQH